MANNEMTRSPVYGLTFPARTDRPTAIVGASVVPMDSERIVEHQTVVIESGTIRSMGPSSQIDVTNMRVVDGSGHHLLPALADMHVHHWELGEAALYLANGVATVRNMSGDSFHLATQQHLDRGEAPGPRIITTSPLIDGLGSTGKTLWPNSGFITHPAQAKPLIERHIEQGFSQIKVYEQLMPESLSALGQAGREAGVMMVGHCPTGMTYEQSIEAGMGCFEHLTGIFTGHFMEGHAPVKGGGGPEDWLQAWRNVADHADLDALRRLGARLASQQVWNCPTITMHQGGRPSEEAMNSPLLEYVQPYLRHWWRSRHDPTPEPLREEMATLRARAIDQRIRVLSILRQEGAPVLIGTDTPNPFVIPGFSIHDEFDNFIAAGFTPFEAIRRATTEAARFMNQGNDWGTLEVGKRADLILVSGNPLNDISKLRRPEAVFTNGWVLMRQDLERLLEERRDQLAQPPELAPAELEQAVDDHAGQIRQRTFVEHRGGSVWGKVCCHAIPRPEGGQIVEEVSSTARERMTFRIFLDGTRRIERAECVIERELGKATTKVERAENGYRVTTKDLDGHERSSLLVSPALYPAETFGLTAFSEVLKNLGPHDRQIDVLSIDRGDPNKISVSIDRITMQNGTEFKLGIDRPGTPKEQTYRLDDGGELQSVEDFLGWGGSRKFVAEDSA